MIEERLKEKKNNIQKDFITNDVKKISNNVVDEVVADSFDDKQLNGEELVHDLVIVDQESKKCEEKSEELKRSEKSSSKNNS